MIVAVPPAVLQLLLGRLHHANWCAPSSLNFFSRGPTNLLQAHVVASEVGKHLRRHRSQSRFSDAGCLGCTGGGLLGTRLVCQLLVGYVWQGHTTRLGFLFAVSRSSFHCWCWASCSCSKVSRCIKLRRLLPLRSSALCGLGIAARRLPSAEQRCASGNGGEQEPTHDLCLGRRLHKHGLAPMTACGGGRGAGASARRVGRARPSVDGAVRLGSTARRRTSRQRARAAPSANSSRLSVMRRADGRANPPPL